MPRVSFFFLFLLVVSTLLNFACLDTDKGKKVKHDKHFVEYKKDNHTDRKLEAGRRV